MACSTGEASDAMQAACGFFLLTSIYPLWHAWRANRRTTLLPAVCWAMLAWSAWVGTWAAAVVSPGQGTAVLPYLALSLTGCAGVAVLGARRPGVSAWNFVVLALLAVLLLPLAEIAISGTAFHLGPFRTVFLIVLLGTTVTNYLPTRAAAGAMLLAFASGLAMAG